MAIKGKRKGKARSGRTVTAGPRPAYVAPKAPIFQRTGTKVVAVILIEALLFAVLIGFDVQSDAEREQEAVAGFTQLVEAAMFQEGTVQALPAGALVLPELGQTISTLGTEEADPRQIVGQAEGWSESATGAAERVGQVRVPGDRLDESLRGELFDSKALLERGLLAYATLADLVGSAAGARGELQDRLVASVQESFVLAGSIFDAGYSKLQAVRGEVGLPTGSAPPGGGLPGGGLPGGGIPGLPGGEIPGGEIPGLPGGEIPGIPGGEVPGA